MERFRIPMDEYRHEGMHAFRRRSKAQLRDVLPEETGTVIAVLIGLAAVGLVLLLGSGLMGRIVYGLTPSAGAETYYVTADELNAIKAKQTPGDTVSVKIDRNGKEMTLDLVIPQPTEVDTTTSSK